MRTEETKNTYTVSEVAELFDVNRDTVIRMIKDGRLDGKKVGLRSEITKESMIKLVQEGRINVYNSYRSRPKETTKNSF